MWQGGGVVDGEAVGGPDVGELVKFLAAVVTVHLEGAAAPVAVMTWGGPAAGNGQGFVVVVVVVVADVAAEHDLLRACVFSGHSSPHLVTAPPQLAVAAAADDDDGRIPAPAALHTARSVAGAAAVARSVAAAAAAAAVAVAVAVAVPLLCVGPRHHTRCLCPLVVLAVLVDHYLWQL